MSIDVEGWTMTSNATWKSISNQIFVALMTPTLHPPNSLGTLSQLYTMTNLRLDYQNFMQHTYALYGVRKLEPPYQTKCRHQSATYSQTECLKQPVETIEQIR